MNKWLIQKNIWNEYGYDRFIQSMHDNDVDFEEVHVIPFTDTFDKEIDFKPTQIFGSGRFVNICRDRGFNTYKSFKPFEEFYVSINWVNGQGRDITWERLLKLKGTRFIRPIFVKPYTEKFFTGMVLNDESDLDKIQIATSFIADENKELVRISPAITIYNEVRLFIVGGEIITGSLYKTNGQNKQSRIDNNHPAWQQCKMILHLEGFIDAAFVIDMGQVELRGGRDSWRIVELNNINSSGLYECDTDAIVRAFKYLE
jgi:hypothetical protein